MSFLLGASGLVAALLGSGGGGGRGLGRELEVREWKSGGNNSAVRLLTWCETPEVVAVVQAFGGVDCSKHLELGGLQLPLDAVWERSVVFDRVSNTLTLASGPSSDGNLCRLWHVATSLDLGLGTVLLGDDAPGLSDSACLQRDSFCLPAGASLRLDVPLLLPAEQPAPRPSLLCARLRAALLGRGAFTVTSGTRGGPRAGRLDYWQDYCATRATSIHLWHQAPPQRSERGPAMPSPCDVRSVSGLALSGPEPQPLHCVEDVLSYLSNGSSNCHHSPASPLVFVSALDLRMHGSSRGSRVEHAHLARVLRAFANHAALQGTSCPASLLVRSLQSSSILSEAERETGHSVEVEEDALAATAVNMPQISTSCIDQKPNASRVEPTGGVYLVALSRMYVLAFVLPEQLAAAQVLVDLFRRMCTTGVCHLYVTYYISTVAAEEPGSQVGTGAGARGAGPSMRRAWLQTLQFMEAHARSKDVMAVLVGMEALRAFPGISPSGVIPSVEYGQNAAYRLPAPLIVASSASSPSDGPADTSSGCEALPCSTESAWDVRAMAGTAGALWDLYEEVQRGAGYVGASDAALRRSVIAHAFSKPSHVLLDLERSFFDFTPAGHQRALTMAAIMSRADLHKQVALLPEEEAALGVARSVARLQVIAPAHCFATADTRPTLEAALRTLFGSASVPISHALALARALQHNGLSSCCSSGSSQGNQDGSAEAAAEAHLWELARSAEGLLAAPRSVALLAVLEAAELLEKSLHAPAAATGRCASASPFTLAASQASDSSALAALAGLYLAASSAEQMTDAYTLSLLPSLDSFSAVHAARTQWRHQRQRLRLSSAGLPVTHFITMASTANDALGNLRITADLAGVPLTVLGLGSEWRGYSDKLRHYTRHLSSPAAEISDDDVVVLMDAYDVLLFPAARRMGAALAESSDTPIVFCAENGVYPESASAGLYRRGARAHAWRATDQEQRFLNSGCIAGRAGQMRAMLQEADAHGAAFQNDQHFFVRYMLAHPGLVSVDVHRRFFATAFKLSLRMHVETDLSLRLDPADSDSGADANANVDRSLPPAPPLPSPFSSVGLVHFNNLVSSNSYALVLVQLVAVLEASYNGPDGAALLEAVRCLAEGKVAEAAALLDTPAVLANASSNSLSAFIRQKYHLTSL